MATTVLSRNANSYSIRRSLHQWRSLMTSSSSSMVEHSYKLPDSLPHRTTRIFEMRACNTETTGNVAATTDRHFTNVNGL
ncbi:hypothetical protein Ancab_018504, partial [Ancistrocladus abbreviatus]